MRGGEGEIPGKAQPLASAAGAVWTGSSSPALTSSLPPKVPGLCVSVCPGRCSQVCAGLHVCVNVHPTCPCVCACVCMMAPVCEHVHLGVLSTVWPWSVGVRRCRACPCVSWCPWVSVGVVGVGGCLWVCLCVGQVGVSEHVQSTVMPRYVSVC